MQQENQDTMKSSIRIRDTLGLLLAIVAGAGALAGGVAAEIDVPAARLLVAECQGFEALASVGNARLSCAPAISADDSKHSATQLAGDAAARVSSLAAKA